MRGLVNLQGGADMVELAMSAVSYKPQTSKSDVCATPVRSRA